MTRNPTSRFLQDSTKALYQPWREEAFQADYLVRALTPLQRWMYRTLLQSAFVCSERPYLPNNDAILWILAGSESRQQWDDNKTSVLDLFKKETIKDAAGEDKPVLSHGKLLDDWARMQVARTNRHEAASKAGRASAEKRWCSKNDNPDEPKTETDDSDESAEVSEIPQSGNGALGNGERNGNGTLTQRQRNIGVTSTPTNQRNGTKHVTTTEGGQEGGTNEYPCRECGVSPPLGSSDDGGISLPPPSDTCSPPAPFDPGSSLRSSSPPSQGAQVAQERRTPGDVYEALQSEWIRYRKEMHWVENENSFDGEVGPVIPRIGLDKTIAAIGNCSLSEVQNLWANWLRERYEESLTGSNPIEFPLSVFALDFKHCAVEEQS